MMKKDGNMEYTYIAEKELDEKLKKSEQNAIAHMKNSKFDEAHFSKSNNSWFTYVKVSNKNHNKEERTSRANFTLYLNEDGTVGNTCQYGHFKSKKDLLDTMEKYNTNIDFIYKIESYSKRELSGRLVKDAFEVEFNQTERDIVFDRLEHLKNKETDVSAISYFELGENQIVSAKAVWNEYSGTFRTPVENYVIATLDVDGKLNFDIIDGAIKESVLEELDSSGNNGKSLSKIQELEKYFTDYDFSPQERSLMLSNYLSDVNTIKPKDLYVSDFLNHTYDTRAAVSGENRLSVKEARSVIDAAIERDLREQNVKTGVILNS